MLVQGTLVKHRLRDDDAEIEVWYNGKIITIDGNTVSIEYEGYTDVLDWPKSEIMEDIKSKDFVLAES